MNQELEPPFAVWYHGTLEDRAESILRNGFFAGSHFGERLEDSLVFGGPHIFAVYFPRRPAKGWQVVCNEPIPPDRIVWYRYFQIDTRYINKELRLYMKRVDHASRYPDREFCEECGGKGQYEDHDDYLGWATIRQKKITACKSCGGHGMLNYWVKCEKCDNQLGPGDGTICHHCKGKANG